MRIGIVGGGIAGMASAHLLYREHDVELLEANDYIGGHTHTRDVAHAGDTYRVNTGFIVFNRENYPNFVKLIEGLDVAYQPTRMSFSVSCERTGIEYGFATWDAVFAQRRNALSPTFLRMLWEIRRFREAFPMLLADPASASLTLGEYLRQCGYSRRFVDQFIIPFGAAIWSAAPDAFGQFPLRTFVMFFKNHGFLSESTLLQWYTIAGGSARYVEKLLHPFRDRVHTSTVVTSVERRPTGDVRVLAADGTERFYDRVVLAVHSDQALRMIAGPTVAEQTVLGALRYQPNDVVLHTDVRLLPRHRQTWSSWNYRIPRERGDRCTVTYHMNTLQTIAAPAEFLVTLNQSTHIGAAHAIDRYIYDHPVYTPSGVEAQGRFADINGVDRLHFAGAYWGYGFHEDGVNSALAACRPLGCAW